MIRAATAWERVPRPSAESSAVANEVRRDRTDPADGGVLTRKTRQRVVPQNGVGSHLVERHVEAPHPQIGYFGFG